MDEPTASREPHDASATTDRLGSGRTTPLAPHRTEHRLLMFLLPMFAAASIAGWLVTELQDSSTWYERYVLVPSAAGFLALMAWNGVSPLDRVARVRNAALVLAPGIVMVRFVQNLWDLHIQGFDPAVYFGIAPWLIFCTALYIFLLPPRLSWRFAAAYYGLTLVMLAVFLAVNRRPLPDMVITEFVMNTVVAPPVFIVLLSAFTKMRADYMAARTHAKDLAELALLDSLTGLPNRRAFRQSYKRANARQIRQKSPMCLMLIDIDHFKRVNDTYGHQVGDDVLVKLAGVLTRELRGTDEVFRWGGEEFMVLLEETPEKHLAEVAERLRAAVEAERMLPNSTLTVSIGATHALPTEPVEAVYPRADEALYASKRDGRNRVTILGEPTTQAPEEIDRLRQDSALQ
jgi:diguanylate cyclase (GGDEF)-like protein